VSLILAIVMALQGAATTTASEAAQTKPPAFTLHGYVLQVGAYSDLDSAKAAAATIGGQRMFILPIRREQEDWFILLYDNYTNREYAELAARQFQREHPQESAWVRDAAPLRQLLRLRTKINPAQ
jgi:septal ring-binding cell division protein DamX